MYKKESYEKSMTNTTKDIKSICVYCGAAARAGDVFKQAATAMGKLIAKEKMTLIYGGGSTGLMGLVADSALTDGAKVIGIIPEHIRVREVDHTGLTELHVVETMHERKQMMVDLADAFIILPGGLGTLDEFFEIMTWRQLGLHSKPILLVNINGYWDGLVQLIRGMIDNGFVRQNDLDMLLVVDHVDDAIPALRAAPQEVFDPQTKWI